MNIDEYKWRQRFYERFAGDRKRFGKFRLRRRIAGIIIGGAIILYAFIAWSGAGVGSGYATWYALFGNYTFCGDVVTAEDWTAAMPNAGTASMPCGQKLTVCYAGECARGVVVTDKGPAYWTGNSIDLNLPVANRLGMVAAGRVPVTWWKTGYDPNYAYK